MFLRDSSMLSLPLSLSLSLIHTQRHISSVHIIRNDTGISSVVFPAIWKKYQQAVLTWILIHLKGTWSSCLVNTLVSFYSQVRLEKSWEKNTSDLMYLLHCNNEVYYMLFMFRSKDSFLDLAAAANEEVCKFRHHISDSTECSQTNYMFALSRLLIV
jgi:hypothetical protein